LSAFRDTICVRFFFRAQEGATACRCGGLKKDGTVYTVSAFGLDAA
jgi:hypothetical protein